jgi:hypothetical protein
VTSIERLAEKEGLQKGLQKGARAELLATIRAGLKDKFGSAGSRLVSKVRAVDELPRLRILARALMKTESLQEFRELLESAADQ